MKKLADEQGIGVSTYCRMILLNHLHREKQMKPTHIKTKHGHVFEWDVVVQKMDDDIVEVKIKDTGTGIAPEIQSRIFEPFFTSKLVGKGNGQGLTIAYNVIVNQHHGKLFFDTEVGKGTTFYIHLPIKQL